MITKTCKSDDVTDSKILDGALCLKTIDSVCREATSYLPTWLMSRASCPLVGFCVTADVSRVINACGPKYICTPPQRNRFASTTKMSSTPLPFFLLNAFAPTLHSGNQAAVVVFDSASHPQSTDEQFMALVARDFNFAETAYLVPLDNNGVGNVGKYGLRWFTPAEVCPIVHAHCCR